VKEDVYLTWRKLKDAIAVMPRDRLDDPVQILPSSIEDPVPLHGVYGIGTVEYYCDCGSETESSQTRGVIDNKNHPEHYVLISDENPHDEHGNTFFTMTEDGWIGDKTGKNHDCCKGRRS
jgi:hypothetical protein